MEQLDIKPIKSPEEHASTIEKIGALMSASALDEHQKSTLEVLAILVEKYEVENFQISLPTPTEAIEFRMEQLGINRAELASTIGFPRSRISEILNGKRGLSLDMIRALHKKLNIPAEVLVGEREATVPKDHPGVEWSKFPCREMANYGWIETLKSYRDTAENCMRELMKKASVEEPTFAGVAFRGTESKRPDPYAVNAWLMYARYQAITNRAHVKFKSGVIDAGFRREIAKLSLYSDGPKRAFRYLKDVGVTPVYVRHLKKTHIDGACFKLPDGSPAIAVTLRHNRLDNFWFTLLHECVHVERHLEQLDFILDETERQTGAFGNDPRMEEEANELARDALVPKVVFNELERHKNNISTSRILGLAKQADVHPAVVAGQWRVISGKYTHFTKLVGQGKVTEALDCA